jgi:DNA-binding Xre family transcriptional regulator
MTRQIITSPGGERMVVIPEAEYERLLETAEDAADVSSVRRFERKLAKGEEELVPAVFANRILAGEHPVAVWRDIRGMAAGELALAAGMSQSYLSQIESGKRQGSVDTLKRISAALAVSLDDLV